MALVLVLWVLMILSAVALELKFSTHLRMRVTANAGDTTKAFFLARAGVEHAVADLTAGRDRVQALADLREDDERPYHNIELGDGTYTLYAGMDEAGDPLYGIGDEAAKINLNNADEDMLARVPGIEPELAALIVDYREHSGQQQVGQAGESGQADASSESAEEGTRRAGFHDLNDLLALEGVDRMMLYGEDQNGNGILDSNEDDGDESWPPDNADGWLDDGLAAYLTTWSAARNVTADGEERVDLSSADASTLVSSVSGLSQQQADSIVAHRQKNKFSSIADLLDVELVEKVEQKPPDGGSPEGQQGELQQGEESGGDKDTGQDGGKNDGKNGDETAKNEQAESDGEAPSDGEEGGQPAPQVKGTGQKAFDTDQFRRIADLVSTTGDEVLHGLINVNTASPEVLACLPDMDEAVARSIVREREGRQEGFTTLADLLDVDGVTEELFKKICPNLTVRSDVFNVRSFGVLRNGESYRCASAVIDRTDTSVRILYWCELE
ncbi:MAG: helix-hairpin-helix domain-containing protein [Candidatus Hydrogenedentes bacterium]|nr:helix-hairpin-helix domain-containing protein [Candidatus Hydrogenedentota bacterium]